MAELREHSEFGASGAHTWGNCPGSVQMARHFRDDDSEAALEGTAVHELFATALDTGKNAADFLGAELKVERNDGTVAAFPVTQDRARNAQLAIDLCRAIAATPGSSFIERRLDLTRLHPRMHSHLDFGHAGLDGCLTIMDYKNGRLSVDAAGPQVLDFAKDERGVWRMVEAEGGGNWQLSLYAIGVALTFRDQFPVAPKWVRLVIVQPNDIQPGPRVKQIVLPFDQVMAMATAFSRAAHAADWEKPPFNPGQHCQYCPAFGACEASRNHLYYSGALLSMDFDKCDPRYLRVLFDELKLLKQRVKNAETAATTRLLRGEAVGDLKLVTTTKHRVFPNEDAMKPQIAAMFGIDALECPTPAQLARLGAKAVEFVNTNAVTPAGEAVAALPGDKRKPFVPRTIGQIFGGN